MQTIRNANKFAPGRKKDIYDFILSGKIVCGHCKNMITGESGTSRNGTRHYYYNCSSKKKKTNKCDFHAVNKQWLEDYVMQTTWNLLIYETTINEIANQVYNLHTTLSENQTLIKSLIAKRTDAIRATNNLITAIEQGIITEQTKARLKELETQISQYEFDIEQEKQRNYTYLTPDKIRDYLQSIIKGDICNINIQKEIVYKRNNI